jgi:CubicO group peptidase (beta-lactamase class C family)
MILALDGCAAAQRPAEDDSELEIFDRLMTGFLERNQVPGAALAITRGKRLIYARGFGYADVESREPVAPMSRFRIASVSKPITAVAVMRLVERGRLRLDDRILDVIGPHLGIAPSSVVDPRWRAITILHLLRHQGGWDRAQSFDPVGRAWQIAGSLHIRPPVTPAHLVRYMLGVPLDFAPGERHAYSNFGYVLLGRAIEAVAGEPYEGHVRREVLAPLGITGMRLGRALLADRAPGEVKYYDRAQRHTPALFGPHLGQLVPFQYGGENFESFEAHGGWIASAVELVRFVSAFDDPKSCPVLAAASIQTMWSRPPGAAGFEADGHPRAAYYGCGWSVRPVGDDGRANTWHGGLVAGACTLLVRRYDGLDWAVLFNTDSAPDHKVLSDLIDARLHQAAAAVFTWPELDRFPELLGRG